jgi:mannose-6-phosphate isomerase-like protein (cupin superfamily)
MRFVGLEIEVWAAQQHRPTTEIYETHSSYHLIKPEELSWRPSNLMRIPNADYLERTGSENLGARLWRLPPQSANTLHKHIRAEEFYFVLEGTGRMRVGDETLTVLFQMRDTEMGLLFTAHHKTLPAAAASTRIASAEVDWLSPERPLLDGCG